MTDPLSAFSRFRRDGSHSAFREVVAGYLPMVYGVALRLGQGNPAEAEDVCQMVFADLARKAARLRNDAAVGAWLHRHTCFLMKNEIRGNVRRRSREQTAAEQWPAPSDSAGSPPMETSLTEWQSGLDHGLESLREPDRRALVLRYFENRTLREIGDALGIGEDAAQKRVSRALERLRRRLGGRTVSGGVSLAALTAFLSDEVRAKAPESLALTLPASSLRLAAVRRGPLVGGRSRPRTAGSMAVMGLGSLCILLTGWYFWKTRSAEPAAHHPTAAAGKNGNALRPPGRPNSRESTKSPESAGSILEQLRALSREPATSENAAAILALIAAVPAGDLPALAQGIADTGVTGILFRSFPGLFRHWGDHDTASAMDWLIRQVSDEELSFGMSRPWETAFQTWHPKAPKALGDWYAAAMSLRMEGRGPFSGLDTGILLRLGGWIAEKDPGNLENFLTSLPDDPSFNTPRSTFKSTIRNRLIAGLPQRNQPVSAEAVPAAPDSHAAELAAPTPEAYPDLRTVRNLPKETAEKRIAENLRSWSKRDGAAALHWASAHLDSRSAARMLDEIVPVWAKFDPEGLRAWYLVHKESQPVMAPVNGETLPEKIIRALAVSDPVAATDFLVHQCKSLEVQVAQDSWGGMEVARDIAAGLNSAEQCRGVIALLKSWPSPQDQEIQRLEKAALSRWNRWDPAGAKAAGSP